MTCECLHVEADHRSIPPYYCQHGMAAGTAVCKCDTFREVEDREPSFEAITQEAIRENNATEKQTGNADV